MRTQVTLIMRIVTALVVETLHGSLSPFQAEGHDIGGSLVEEDMTAVGPRGEHRAAERPEAQRDVDEGGHAADDGGAGVDLDDTVALAEEDDRRICGHLIGQRPIDRFNQGQRRHRYSPVSHACRYCASKAAGRLA